MNEDSKQKGSPDNLKTQLQIIEEKKKEAQALQAERFKKKFQLVVFKLADESFALHISEIKEVVVTPRITRVPEVPDYIKGVANIRGNIIAIADLYKRFNIEVNKNETPKYTLVLESNVYKVGILVNEVPNTIEVTEDDFDSGGGFYNEAESGGSGIKAIVKKGDNLIVLLNIQKVLENDEVDVLIDRIK